MLIKNTGKIAAGLATLAVATGLLTGCAGNPDGVKVVFAAENYVDIGGTESIRNISDYNLPSINPEGGLQTAFDQALANSKFLNETVGSVQRTDFKDGEYMTYVYDPTREKAIGGFWYQKADETSSFGNINSPLVLDEESFELPLLEQEKLNEFIEREFSVEESAEKPGAIVLTVDLAGYFTWEYTIANSVITQVRVIGEDDASSPVTVFDYGDAALIQALSQKIIVETQQAE